MALPSLFFFTGENEYRLKQEWRQWKTQFIAKHGEENLLVLSSKDLALRDILDAVASAPFIAEKRLVMIEGIPKIEKEGLTTVIEAMHPQTILVIVESKPDKRLTLTKVLLKEATVKEFKPFTPKELQSFLMAEAQKLGATISPDAAHELIEIVGNEPWMLASEVQKLALFAAPTITKEHVLKMAIPSGERIIWGMTNLLGEKRIEDALAFFQEQLLRGEDPYGIWTILLNMMKNTVMVWACMQAGVTRNDAIARETKMSPFAVRGVMPLAQSLSAEQIVWLTRFVAESDIALKSGGFRYTNEHQEEVIALVERAILACA